jgi:hypothetical protein
MIVDRAIMDADFALKMGNAKLINAIQEVIPKVVGQLFVHEHVYNNEILFPASVKSELDRLIEQGRAQIVNRQNVAGEGQSHLFVYDETVSLLEKVIDESLPGKKNWGEIVSIAYARAVGIPIFLSDESALQEVVDNHINTGNNAPGDISIIRISDFIGWMRKAQLDRKSAMIVWLASGKPKEYFRRELWPAVVSTPNIQ